jgi:hypothetical protein
MCGADDCETCRGPQEEPEQEQEQEQKWQEQQKPEQTWVITEANEASE